MHTLLTGKPDEFDRRIEVIEAPRYGLVGQSRSIEIAVRETGSAPSANSGAATLKVRREGLPDETVRTEINRNVKIDMPIPHTGTNIVEIELQPVDGELTTANNRAVVAAEGVRENLRVLLVSGEPHPGERTWRNLLKSDAAVDLVHFTILRPPEKQDGTPINQLSLIAFPTRELFSEKINEFDLIIFDRYEHRGILQLLYYDNIARYVNDHGGALLIAAGDDYASPYSIYKTPLSPVLPAAPTGRVLEMPFKAKVTLEGQKHPVTKDLPGWNAAQVADASPEPSWGNWYRQAEVTPAPRPRRHERRRGQAASDPRPQRQRPRRASDVRSCVALGARLRRRRPAHRSAAPLVALADEGAGPRRGTADRLRQGPQADDRAPLDGGQGRSGEESWVRAAIRSNVTLDTVPDRTGRLALDNRCRSFRAFTRSKPTGPCGTLTAVANAGVEDPREMSEVTATDQKMKPIADATGGGVFWTKSSGLARVCNRYRRAAHLDDVGGQGDGRLRLARSQGPSGVPDPRREADADVHGSCSALRSAGPDRFGLVARGTITTGARATWAKL